MKRIVGILTVITAILFGGVSFAHANQNEGVDINVIQAAITPPLQYVRDNAVEGQALFHHEPGEFTVYHNNGETLMIIQVPIWGEYDEEGNPVLEWGLFHMDATPTLNRIKLGE